MAQLELKHFEEPISRLAGNDAELKEELAKKVAAGFEERVDARRRDFIELEAGRRGIEDFGVIDAEELVSDTGEMTERGALIAESIVFAEGRPVLFISNDQAEIGFLGPDSEVWGGRIETARAALSKSIPPVGRIEVSNHPYFSWIGTGWLIDEDILVTNRHVATEFARRNPSGYVYRTGTGGRSMSAQVDFLEEYQRAASREYAIESVLWIARPDEADVAFLRVKKGVGDPHLPTVLPLATTIDSNDFVATIGYPARDPRIPDQDLVKRIFGDVYEKKRLAPGQILNLDSAELQHDCSTLGGNSGSALVNFSTGEAVGLHFAGLFMQANFAVPATLIQELLQKVRRGETPGTTSFSIPNSGVDTVKSKPGNVPANLSSLGPTTYRFNIPLEVTVSVGQPAFSQAAINQISVSGKVNSEEVALSLAQETLRGNPDVLEVRLGYRFKRGWITDERVIVVEVKEKLGAAEVAASGRALIPPQLGGMGVDIRTASFADQLEHLGVDPALLEVRAKPGLYREPPHLSLQVVKEPMKAIFHVSPDSGFPNLQAFLQRVERELHATIYEWESNHIADEVVQVIGQGNRKLTMVTQRSGTREAVADVEHALGSKFNHVWASVGGGLLIPSAYHIKVASRDGKEFWLSSGNWKDSNQADIDPAGDNSSTFTPLRRHNREWHAIIENETLAQLFREYIKFDFDEAERVPLPEGIEPPTIELFVPDAAFMEDVAVEGRVKYFDPLEINRELEIQPLLTPDRDDRGKRVFISHAVKMMKKGTERIYVENQSFNLLQENEDDFENFFEVLRDKQKAGVDVRIIFRDAREFGRANAPKQQKLIEDLKDFGFDTDFLKVQLRCHTKGIIVDGKEVLLGSHNLTNQGSLFNRDASLLVRDEEVARYFESIFLFDWDNLANQQADELIGGVRIARSDEAIPQGYRRVSLAEYFGES